MKRFLEILKVIVYLIGIVLILNVLIYLVMISFMYTFDYIRVNTFKPPDKFLNIPIESKWGGGVDGGDWLYFKEKKDSIYRFEIYEDWTGTKIIDTDFVICPECKDKIDTIKNISDYFSFFNGREIVLTINSDSSKHCYFRFLNKHIYQ